MKEIRKTWDEMKELNRIREKGTNSEGADRSEFLHNKYEEIDTLFGHESTLSKAIIYCFSQEREARIALEKRLEEHIDDNARHLKEPSPSIERTGKAPCHKCWHHHMNKTEHDCECHHKPDKIEHRHFWIVVQGEVVCKRCGKKHYPDSSPECEPDKTDQGFEKQEDGTITTSLPDCGLDMNEEKRHTITGQYWCKTHKKYH